MLGDSALAALNWVPAAREAVQGFDATLDLRACRRLYYPSCASPPPPTAYEAIGAHGPGFAVLVVAVGYNDLASMTATSFEQVVGRARELGYRQIVWWTLRAVDNGFAARNAVIRDELATGSIRTWCSPTGTATPPTARSGSSPTACTSARSARGRRPTT